MTTSQNVFVDAGEVEVAYLHGASISPTGNFGSNYCVLTDKRIYHKGLSVAVGTKGQFSTSESVIDLKSVTGTSFSICRFPVLLILGLLLIMAAGVLFVVNQQIRSDNNSIYQILAIVAGVVGLLFSILYFVVRRKVFTIIFCGGVLSFRASGIPVKTLHAFSAAIHSAMDKLNADAPCVKAEPVEAPVAESPVAEAEVPANA